MRTPISLFLTLAFVMPVRADSLELLKAKYDAQVSKQKAQVEATVFQRMIGKKGLIFDATDYYKTRFADEQYGKRKKEAEARVNQLRAGQQTDTLEYYKALNDFYTFQKMEYRELSANLEKEWYDSVSYIAREGMKGSWNDAKLVVGEVWSKKWDLLKTLVDKGVGEAVKSLIYETIDATYKVRFVDYAMHSHGATKKIAEYWWDHFIMGNFKKSKTMELIEDVVGKGQEKIQEKLEEKVKDRVKNELIKKGEQLAKEELEKKTKEAAEGFIRNLVTVPSILIECAAKYYNVVDFNLMFLKAAPNEANYLNNEIRRVLKELGTLNDAEVDKCYFDRDYFMSLRKTVGGRKQPPKLQPTQPPKKPETRIKIAVKSTLQPAIEAAWEYYELEDRVDQQAADMAQQAPPTFDIRPFVDLLDAATDELRADAIDHPGFKEKAAQVSRLFGTGLDAWGAALAQRAREQGTSLNAQDIENKKAPYRTTFNRHYDTVVADIDTELNQYHEQIEAAAASLDLRDAYQTLTESIAAKIAAFNAEADARSLALIGNKYLAPTRHSQSIGDLLSEVGTVRYCFFYKAILNPNGTTGQYYLGTANKGHIHNAVVILMAGEWFSKSLYDIWHAGYNGSLQLKNRIEQRWTEVYALLNPERELWRVYCIDKEGRSVYQKDIEALVNSFWGHSNFSTFRGRDPSRAQSKAIYQMYGEYSRYTGFVHNLLKKNETGVEVAKAKFERYKRMLEARMDERRKALAWVNTDGQALSDDNFDAWKTTTTEAVTRVARLIANDMTVPEFREKIPSFMRQRDEIRASQHYAEQMATIEKGLTITLEKEQNSIYLKLADMYSAYFAKYTVPEQAVLQQLKPYAGKIEASLKEKTATEFSSTRITKLYQETPGYYMKDLRFDLRAGDVRFNQRNFFRLFVWDVGKGHLESMTKLANLYDQTLNAQNEVNQWLAKELEALHQRAEAAQNQKLTLEQYIELSGRLDRISIDARLKFEGLVKPNHLYVFIKYTDENAAALTKINQLLLKIGQSLNENGSS